MVEWQACFGGTMVEELHSLRQTDDGGYILAGWSDSGPGGNRTAPRTGDVDYWVVRLNDAGDKLWDRSFGPGYLMVVEHTGDGPAPGRNPGAVVKDGSTQEPAPARRGLLGGDGHPSGTGRDAVWQSHRPCSFALVHAQDQRASPVGEVRSAGTNYNGFIDIEELPDQGFVAVGHSDSGASGTKTSPGFGSVDAWVVRLDAAGQALWDQSYGGTDVDTGIRVALMPDGGFMVAGDSQSPVSGTRTSPGAGNDFWLVRLDAFGNQLYDLALDGGGNEVLRDFRRTAEGGFLCGGESFPGHFY